MLWGNTDNASGSQRPKYANTASANSVSQYGNVIGVSVAEVAAGADGRMVQHAGWVSQKIGTGGLSYTINNPGTGVNANGFLLISDASGRGGVANAPYQMGNTQNTLQNYSTNPALNGVVSIVNVSSSGWINAQNVTITLSGAATIQPNITATVGGRAGRRNYETLVAAGSITGDNPADNPFFTGA